MSKQARFRCLACGHVDTSVDRFLSHLSHPCRRPQPWWRRLFRKGEQ